MYNHLTVCKQMRLGLFKNVYRKLFANPMDKKILALNNRQTLICHKTKPNHLNLICTYKEDLTLNNLQ